VGAEIWCNRDLLVHKAAMSPGAGCIATTPIPRPAPTHQSRRRLPGGPCTTITALHCTALHRLRDLPTRCTLAWRPCVSGATPVPFPSGAYTCIAQKPCPNPTFLTCSFPTGASRSCHRMPTLGFLYPPLPPRHLAQRPRTQALGIGSRCCPDRAAGFLLTV
jgi:hypothetical protein